jgi:hypothetical protein
VRPSATTNCNDKNISGPRRGSVSFRVETGQIVATIKLRNAQPHATYEVFQRCVTSLGYIATGGKGAGNATFTYPPQPGGSNGIDLRILGEEHIDMGPFPLSL